MGTPQSAFLWSKTDFKKGELEPEMEDEALQKLLDEAATCNMLMFFIYHEKH